MSLLLAQVSDTHVVGSGHTGELYVDNNDRLRLAVERLMAEPVLPDAVLLTGDLTDLGTAEEMTIVADLLSRNGVPVITAAISPYREIRDEAREMMGDRFIEVYIEASVDACAERDVKGLYKKAFAGEIKEFTGVSDPYEEPLNAEITLKTEDEEPEESAARLIAYLEERGLLAPKA